MANTETRRIQFEFTARDRGVQKTTKETGDSIEHMNDGLEGGAGKMGKLGAVAGKLGPVMMAVGAAAALIGPAISKGLDAQAANAKFRAQLGLTAKESGRIGGVAGKLYSSAYGESMDDVRTAITAVIRNMDGMRNASSADLQATSARAMDLATVMGEDVGPVTVAVGQMMKTGLAKNSKEAFDILTVGAQKGANKAEDLLDTFNEYSTQFRDLGLSGAQAMGIIQQGLQGGARDADLVADAMKELNIRVQDQSAAPALQELGLNAKSMAEAFAHGGPTASHALDQITDRLRKVKDPTQRYALAQKLLGTQSEDMSKALMSIDPSEATKKLGKFGGATDAAGKAMGSTFKARLTGFKRTLETQVTNVATRALNVLARFGGQISKGFKLPATGKATNDWQRFGVELRKVSDWMRTRLIPAVRQTAEWFEKKIIPVVGKFYKTVLGELFKQLKRITVELGKSGIPWGKLLKAIQAIYAFMAKYLLKLWGGEFKLALKILGTLIVYQIKIYGELWRRLSAVWKVFERGQNVVNSWAKAGGRALASFRDNAVRGFTTVTRRWLDVVGALVHGAAKAFGWVPGVGPKLKSAAKQFDAFKSRVNNAIGGITKKKSAYVTVTAKGKWDIYGSGIDKSVLHDIGKYHGGPITGKGQPGASRHYDSVLGVLRKDEHVVTPEEVDGAGGHGAVLRIRKAMKAGLMKGFFSGGPVGVNVVPQSSTSGQIGSQVVSPINAGYTRMIKSMAAAFAAMWKKMMSGGGVVAAARSMIGYPYSWGGGGKGGPSYGIGRGAGTFGFDCSGLSEYAWWKGKRASIGGVTDSQWANSRPISGPRPGALAFPSGPSVHVMVGSDKPGYVIQAPHTGAFVEEVRRTSGNWRWPKGFYAGGPVGQAGAAALRGARGTARFARALGLIGDPKRARAAGGPVTSGQPYLVGERGPEVMVPRAIGTVHSAGTKVVTVTQNITVEIKATPGVNKAELGRELNDLLAEYKRRGGRLAGSGKS